MGALPIFSPASKVYGRTYTRQTLRGVALQGSPGPIPAPRGFAAKVNTAQPAFDTDQSHAVFVAPEHLTALLG
jgi:hypothetical protein